MTELLDYIEVRSLFETSPTIKFLSSKHVSSALTFLYNEYKLKGSFFIPYQQLILKLGDFLEEIHHLDQEGERHNETASAVDYELKAKRYIDQWIASNYLRNIIDDQSKEPQVYLSQHMEKAFLIFDSLKEREFVGTESKFRDIFTKIKDILEHANPDREKRIEELENKKREIEEEIAQIREDGFVSTYEDYQIKSRYEEVNRMANELVGDFKEVENNFKEITRRIYEQQQQTEVSKGKLLSDTFDALYTLKSTDQGKSFYGFWQFILDDAGQSDFQQMVRDLHEVLRERSISVPSNNLIKLKRNLHFAARKVLDKNSILADKLSREIVAREQVEAKQLLSLMAEIRQLALRLVTHSPKDEAYLWVDYQPAIQMPLERKLKEKSENQAFQADAQVAQLRLEELQDLSRMYQNDFIDKKKLLQNVYELLETRSQVTLQEIVSTKGLERGLAELLSYVNLVNSNSKFFINPNLRENILFDPEEGRYLDIPQIIYAR